MLSFSVNGVPVAQGSPRAFTARDRRTGKLRAHVALDSTKLKRWRKDLAHAAALASWRRPPIDGPVSVVAHFRFTRPRSRKEDGEFKATKPDLDKLCRALGDALTEAGVLVDDSRIVGWLCSKRYSDIPGVDVMVTAPLQIFKASDSPGG